MNIPELAQAIVADAQREAARIEQNAHESVGQFEGETERLLRERREKMLTQAKQKKEDEDRRETARAERDANLAILAKKRELIDETFTVAAQRIAQQKGAARRARLTRMLESANKRMRISAIAPVRSDAVLLRSMAAKHGIKVRGVVEGDGGFIAYSADNNVAMDVRFTAILERVRAAEVTAVADMLFARPAPIAPKAYTPKPRTKNASRRKSR